MNTTIKEDITFEIEIKKSRFICHLKRIDNEDMAREYINQIKKEHYKANHNCSAYTLGENQEIQRSSDDGEPSGTAGIPMLEILKKRGIINTLAVVTRYFGGTKLGASGLIRAYSGSVNNALDTVQLVRIVEQQEIILEFDYNLFDSLNRYLESLKIKLINPDFSEKVMGQVYIDTDQTDSFMLDLKNHFNDKIMQSMGNKSFVEVDI